MNTAPSTRFADIRLSKHYLLLDVLHDYDMYSKSIRTNVPDILAMCDIEEGRALFTQTVEPLVEHLGPASVAAGLCAEGMHYKGSPHAWTRPLGACVDLAFHGFLADGNAPIELVNIMGKLGLQFERFISYAGSENVCLSHRRSHNRFATYENVLPSNRSGKTKPYFNKIATNPKEFHDLLAAHAPEHGPMMQRSSWRRAAGQPIYHTRKNLRAQHVRAGKYFTLLDFARCETAIVEGINWVAPVYPVFDQLTHATDSAILRACRMAAQLLDPVTAKVGRLSITRGYMRRAVAEADVGPAHAKSYMWGEHSEGNPLRVSFMLPQDASPEAALDILADDPYVEDVMWEAREAGHEMTVEWCPFKPRRYWGSFGFDGTEHLPAVVDAPVT